jgi:hypothetical protein
MALFIMLLWTARSASRYIFRRARPLVPPTGTRPQRSGFDLGISFLSGELKDLAANQGPTKSLKIRWLRSTYELEGRIIFAAIFTTKLLGATRSDSIISRFIAPEIT